MAGLSSDPFGALSADGNRTQICGTKTAYGSLRMGELEGQQEAIVGRLIDWVIILVSASYFWFILIMWATQPYG